MLPENGIAPAGDAYVRGGVAGANRTPMLRVFVAIGLAGLAALFVVLAIQAATENARADRLRRSGIPVTATVTSCLGVASGTGITESSFQCTASFVEQGARHSELLRGSTVLLAPGATVAAVVAPHDPGSLTAVAATGHRSPWSRYLAAAIALALLVLTTAAVVRTAGQRSLRAP